MSIEANEVIRTTAACWRLCEAGEAKRAAELLHPDFVHDDRRSGLSNKLTNRDDTIANNCAFVELGFSVALEPVALHGERLALCKALFTDAGGNEIVGLQVLSLDEQGLRRACVSFDESDFADAVSEFEAARRRL